MGQSYPTVFAEDIEKVLFHLSYTSNKAKSGTSHRKYTKSGTITHVVVPFHKGQSIKIGTFSSILKQIGIDRKKFFEILRNI